MPSDEAPPLKRFASLLPRAPDVHAGAAFDAWHLRVMSRNEFDAMADGAGSPTREQLLYFAWFGSLAPTSHNTVPQRFCLSAADGQLGLWLDRHFVLPESDARGRQATISCGCALSYLIIAAAAYGWRTFVESRQVESTQVLPMAFGGAQYTELACMKFERFAASEYESAWLSAMIARKTIRADFDPQVTITEALVQEMKCLVAKYEHTQLHLLTDAVSLTALGKFQELADTTVYNRERFARELGHWLLQNDADAPLGMRGREFGLSDDSSRRFHRGLLGVGQLLPDEVAGLAKAANRALRSASAVLVLSVDADTIDRRLEAGRAFGEIGLLLQRRGFATAMHAAVTEVESANMALRGRLRTTCRPVVLCRVGIPVNSEDWLRPHSSRPPVTDLLMEDGGVAGTKALKSEGLR